MKYIVQLVLMIVAIAVFGLLQLQYWFGENGRSGSAILTEKIVKQQALLDEQIEINRVLSEDVKDLKNGLEAIEEHARLDLGYIRPGETFVQMSLSDDLAMTKESSGNKSIEAVPETYLSPE